MQQSFGTVDNLVNEPETAIPSKGSTDLLKALGDLVRMIQFGTACLINSKCLLADAELLYQKESYGSALALAAVACEEANKPLLFPISKLTSKIKIPSTDKEAIRSVNPSNAMYSHIAKLSSTPLSLILSELHASEGPNKIDIQAWTGPALKYRATLSKELFYKKNKGLYVDIENNKVITPSETSRADAEWAISEARTAVKRLNNMKFLHELDSSNKRRKQTRKHKSFPSQLRKLLSWTR